MLEAVVNDDHVAWDVARYVLGCYRLLLVNYDGNIA
jgi:hypothetical protein